MEFQTAVIGPGRIARSLKIRQEILQPGKIVKLNKNIDVRQMLGARVYKEFVSKRIIDEDQRTFDFAAFNELIKKNTALLTANLQLRREEQPNSYNFKQAMGRIIEKTRDNFESIYNIKLFNRSADQVIYTQYHDEAMKAIKYLMEENARHWNSIKAKLDKEKIAVNLSGAIFIDHNTPGVNLKAVDLSYATLRSAFMTSSDLSLANLRESTLVNVDFSNSKMDRIDFTNAHLMQVEFMRASLAEAFFIGATLEDTTLSRGNIEGAIFKPVLN